MTLVLLLEDPRDFTCFGTHPEHRVGHHRAVVIFADRASTHSKLLIIVTPHYKSFPTFICLVFRPCCFGHQNGTSSENISYARHAFQLSGPSNISFSISRQRVFRQSYANSAEGHSGRSSYGTSIEFPLPTGFVPN